MSELLLKLGGALCVVIATGLWGEYKARGLSLRVEQLQQFQQALHLLAAEISHTITPLPYAFENIGCRLEGLIGDFFHTAGTLMQQGGDINAQEAWQKAMAEVFPHSFLSQEDRRIGEQLGSSLGLADRDSQLKQIKLVDSLLEGALQDALNQRDRNQRMWRYLGVVVGLMLVVIFI